MRLAIITILITATVDLYILFGLDSRGTFLDGGMLLLAAIYLGGAALFTALGLSLARCISPQKLGRVIVIQSFAVAFFFCQLALVREAGARLIANDVEKAKAYCSLLINHLKRNDEGKYPLSVETLHLLPASMPRLLKDREFYTTVDDQREYILYFSWDFDYAWEYNSKDGEWRLHS